MVTLFLSLFSLLLLFFVIKAYRDDGSYKTIIVSIAIISVVSYYSGFIKSMIAYKPLMIAHILLTIYGWYGVFLYLIKRRLDFYALLSPAGTVVLFFLISYYFKEY